MPQFQPIFDFLRALRQNNNHEWFETHRPEYDQARMIFEDFIQGLILRFDVIEPLGDLTAREAIFRINSNLRFAMNMPPYKNHFQPCSRLAASTLCGCHITFISCPMEAH